ncbi:MAG: DUF1822 family protein [Chroococcidiopsidaceae cyanobacterium CP_BM_RX_35]|nr:DUF1822 family protein [Chroococcidiopsidaceae cyanobacterium CP_BM_RX_35]
MISFSLPTELWLEVSPSVQNQAWQQSQSCLTPSGRWNAYLNQMCLSTFLPWLQAEYVPEALPDVAVSAIWQVTNGTAIAIGSKRLVLIPSKTLETREFYVPQEWVDIPSWAGDYYLAVQVDLEGEWMRIWGYTTHEQLKTSGSYEADERLYCLDASEMIPDLNVLWVMWQLCPDEQTRSAIAPLPELSDIQVENLWQRLTSSAVSHPRLELPLSLWGALLEREDWQQQLARARGESSRMQANANLSQWFQNVFEEGWQAIETLLGQEPSLAFNFRQAPASTEPEVVRVKLLDLETQAGHQAVLLMVTLAAHADSRIEIRVQLYPLNPTSYLPVHVKLALLSTAGEVVQSVQAREQDDCIQLKRFKCLPGKRFSIQVGLDGCSLTEAFVS